MVGHSGDRVTFVTVADLDVSSSSRIGRVIEMTTQRATAGAMHLTTMSTKAAAFTIDELLRPVDARARADPRNNDSANDDLLQRRITDEAQRRGATQCPPHNSTGEWYQVNCLSNVV